MVDSVSCLCYAECSRAPDYINVGFLGRWGTYACPQCLPSGTVPIRSWTWTLRPPGIRHRHGCLCLCLCLSLCLHRCLCMCLCLCLLLRLCVIPCHTPLRAIPASLLHYRSCVPTLIHMYEPPHERPHVHSHRTPRMPQATGRPTLSPPLSLFLPSPPAPSVLARYFNGVPSKNLLPCATRVASGVRCVHSACPPLSVDHGPCAPK